MLDALNRSAFEGLLDHGIHGADDGQGVVITVAPECTLIHASGNAEDDDFVSPLEKALGLALPRSAGVTTDNGETRVLWLGPDQWLIKAPLTPYGELERKIAAAVPTGAFNDVTHGRTTLRLKGPKVREILAGGCPLDLHPTQFTAGQCASSLLGHLNAVFDCVYDDVFDVTVTRSYAEDLVSWITRSAAEYGYTVAQSE